MRTIIRLTLLLVLLKLSFLATAEEGTGPQPAYHELKPSLIANLAANGKYIRIDVQLMTLDAELLPNIQLHAPAIRHALLMLLSEQDGAVADTPDGKEKLRQQAMEASRKLMREQTGKSSIDELFITAFFVQ
jgi:flagellar FliL protein